jgi:hypothetical protein
LIVRKLGKVRDLLIITVLGALLVDLIHGLENLGLKVMIGGI